MHSIIKYVDLNKKKILNVKLLTYGIRTAMRIIGKRIRNLDRYISDIPPNSVFRVVERSDPDSLNKIGFSENVKDGETILPRKIGPITRFNSDGRSIIRRDLPKKSRYIRTVRWRWNTWDGTVHEDFKAIYRDCFQRELIPAPSVELTYSNIMGGIISSKEISFENKKHSEIIHIINIFLEIFGSCDLICNEMDLFNKYEIKKVNWKILPTGEIPWDFVINHIKEKYRRLSEDSLAVIMDRQKTIQDFRPTEIWSGNGGFDDYIAYVFGKNNLVILESIRYGNALYAFSNDWRALSRLTKAEIIQGDLAKARIIHTENWKRQLSELFRSTT